MPQEVKKIRSAVMWSMDGIATFTQGFATLFAGMLALSVVLGASGLLGDFTHVSEKNRELYYRFLDEGIKQDIFSEKYARTGFNRFDRLERGNFSQYGYIALLEDYYVSRVSSPDNSPKNGIEAVREEIERASLVEPFASLPPEERRLMDSIQRLILAGDMPGAVSELAQLKQVILARSLEYEKIDKQNSWSIPLAIAGLAFTIIFGISGLWSFFQKRRLQTS